MSGNPYIAQQRATFAAEIAQIHSEICAMMISEDENNPRAVLESLLNRTLYMRSRGAMRTLHQMISGGFYGPYNRGLYPRFERELATNHSLQASMNAAIADVLAGSDEINGFTDQGMPTDPNGHRQPRIIIGGDVFNDWDGGPGGAAGAAAWRQQFEVSALQAALKIAVTGKMDDATRKAVELFQKQNKLAVDGIAGPMTWAAINKQMAAVS